METELRVLLLATLSAAVIVVCGGMYALFLTLGRLGPRPLWPALAHLSYGGVVAGAGMLAWALELSGWWLALVAVLLAGYYAAPLFIWHLSVATHAAPAEPARQQEARQ